MFLILSLAYLLPVHASLYVIKPRAGASCQASQSCTVQWLDDGSIPLLSSTGPCAVGLYIGEETLVQTISPVDVSSTMSFNFKPDPRAGPNSNDYYIAFTSLSLRDSNGTNSYQAFSPSFRITGMTGSLSNPIPSDTSTHPVPSSVAHVSSAVVKSTSTVGTLSTASGFTTATSPTASATPVGTPSSSVGGESINSAAGSLDPSVWISLIGFTLATILVHS